MDIEEKIIEVSERLAVHEEKISAIENKVQKHVCTQDDRICRLDQNYEMLFAMVTKVQADVNKVSGKIDAYHEKALKLIDDTRANKYTTIWSCIGVIVVIFLGMLGFYFKSTDKVFDQLQVINTEISAMKYNFKVTTDTNPYNKMALELIDAQKSEKNTWIIVAMIFVAGAFILYIKTNRRIK